VAVGLHPCLPMTGEPAWVRCKGPFAAAACSCAQLRLDRTIGGSGDALGVVPGITNYYTVAVGAGLNYSVALLSNGSAVVWGAAARALQPPAEAVYGLTAIAAGHQHIMALRQDGRVVVW
jgi:hypothetical protein